MPGQDKECKQWIEWIKKTSADDPLSFAISGSKAEIIVTMARNKKPEILKKLIRDDVDERVKTDKKFKDDRAFWNWGDLYEERGVLTLRFQKDVKTGLAKTFRRFFKNNGAPLKFDLQLLGPDGVPAEALGMNDSDDDAPSPPNPQAPPRPQAPPPKDDPKAVSAGEKAYVAAKATIEQLVRKGKVPIAWNPADYNEIARLYAEAEEKAGAKTVAGYINATTLIQEAETIRTGAVAEVAKRVEMAKEVARLSERVEALTDGKTAGDLSSELAELNVGLRNDPDFDFLSARMQKARDAVAEAEKAQQEGRDARPENEKKAEIDRENAIELSKLRMGVMQSVEPMVANALKDMRGHIAEMLRSLNAPDLKPEHFSFVLDQIFEAKKSFFAELNQATDRRELDKLARQAQARMDQAVTIAARALTDGTLLDKFKARAEKAAQAEKDRPVFLKARAALVAMENALRDAGLDEAANKMTEAVDACEAEANDKKDYLGAAAKLGNMKQAAEQMLQKRAEALRARREQVAQSIATYEKEMAQTKGSSLGRLFKKIKGDSTNDASFQAIAAELKKAKAMIKTANTEDAIDAAAALLEAVDKALEDLEKVDGQAATFNKLIADLDKVLASKTLSAHPAIVQSLRKDYEEAKGEVDPLDLSASNKTLAALLAEATEERAIALRKKEFRASGVTRRKEMKAALTKLSAAIAKAAKTSGDEKLKNGYIGPLNDDLTELKVTLANPDLDDVATKKKMDEIQGRISLLAQKAQSGGPALIAALDEDVKAAEKKKQDEAEAAKKKAEDKKKINVIYKELNAKIKQAEKAIKAVKGDLGELNEMKKSVSLAYKNRNENSSGAIKVFTRTLERAIELVEHPGGPAAKSLAQLPNAPKAWRESVVSGERAAETLMLKVRAAAGDSMSEDALDAMEKELMTAMAAFDPHAFDADVALLCDLEQPQDRRAKAKEALLRKVRSYQRLVMSDPILLHAAANPFRVPQMLTPMYTALGDLELNASRARV